MKKDRNQVARQVGEQLAKTEWAMDGALAEMTQLGTTLASARNEARTAITIGGDALAEVCAAIATMAEARQKLVAAHNALEETRLELGLQPVLFGGLADKRSVSIRLRAVS